MLVCPRCGKDNPAGSGFAATAGGFRFRAGAALVRLLSAMALANLLAESHDSILDGTKTALIYELSWWGLRTRWPE